MSTHGPLSLGRRTGEVRVAGELEKVLGVPEVVLPVISQIVTLQ